MERAFGTHAQVMQAVAEARGRNDFAAIDAALADVVDRAAGGDQKELAFLLEVIDQHRLALGTPPVQGGREGIGREALRQAGGEAHSTRLDEMLGLVATGRGRRGGLAKAAEE